KVMCPRTRTSWPGALVARDRCASDVFTGPTSPLPRLNGGATLRRALFITGNALAAAALALLVIDSARATRGRSRGCLPRSGGWVGRRWGWRGGCRVSAGGGGEGGPGVRRRGRGRVSDESRVGRPLAGPPRGGGRVRGRRRARHRRRHAGSGPRLGAPVRGL